MTLIYNYSLEYMTQEPVKPSDYRPSESELGEDPTPTLKAFQLFGPDSNAILTEVWSLVIEPGDLITMRFRDDKLNGIGAHPVTVAERSLGWLRSWWSPKDSVGVSKNGQRNGQNRVKLARGRNAVEEWLERTISESIAHTGSLSDD